MDVLILISIYILRKEKFEFYHGFSLTHFYIFTTSPIHMNIYRWTFYNSEEKDGFQTPNEHKTVQLCIVHIHILL